jgi:ribosome maturation factor RimP
MHIAEKIEETVAQIARDLDYMIYDVSILLKGENSRIFVKIDHLKGISHYDCEVFSKELSKRLDDDNILPNYSLEVSSPGLRRELRGLDDFRRFKDSPVKIIYTDVDKRSVVKGIIMDVGKDNIELSIGGDTIRLSLDRIVKANLEFY